MTPPTKDSRLDPWVDGAGFLLGLGLCALAMQTNLVSLGIFAGVGTGVALQRVHVHMSRWLERYKP